MAILKSKDIKKMSEKEKKDKLIDLRMELVRGSVTANKANAKTKELKRAIARLLTSININTSKKEELKK